MAVLTFNAGSSSLKFAVFDGARALLRGAFENIEGAPKASATKENGGRSPKCCTGGRRR
jgi:acetate kinase